MFFSNVTNLYFSECLLGIFYLAVTFKRFWARKQEPAGPLALQSITRGYKAKLIFCLAQKDMCQFLSLLELDVGSGHGSFRLALKN